MLADAEKTEKPTPKRRREARREGQIARSRDLSGWVTLLAASFALPPVLRSGTQRVEDLVSQGTHVMDNPTPGGALTLLQHGLADAMLLALPLVGLIGVVGLLVTVAQVGFVVATKAAAPSLRRLNPVAGLKRLVSVSSLWMLLEQSAKLAVLVALTARLLSTVIHDVLPGEPVAMGPVVAYAGSAIVGLVRDVAAAGLVLSIADYAFQRRRTNRSLRMTKLEVKEESRQSEGDPFVKRALRRKQVSLSRMRMMAAVAGADVVVTNPTHYAVALRYEPGKGRAPHVVAKGSDHLALRIREEACRRGVPVVEDPPLARALHGACELGDSIPRELYVAVARLLAFVLTLPAVVRTSGVVQRRPTSALVA